MSERQWKLFAEDIIQSIIKIQSYTKGMSEKDFIKDNKTSDAVIRNFEIIGEAANKIPSEIRKKHKEIPWRDIIDFRNRISHEYFGVSMSVVWQIKEKELSSFLNSIKEVVKDRI